MRTLITALAVVIASACTGSTPANIDSGRTCDRRLYDRCLQEHDCDSDNCRPLMSGDFQVCTKTCTVGNDAECGTTADGRPATCDLGICKPPTPNDCILLQR